MQSRYFIILLLVCLSWGGTPVSGKIVVDSFSPLLAIGMRFAGMAAILFLWLFFTGQKRELHPSRPVLLYLAAMGFVGITLHNGLLFTGLTYTTATNTALIESIGPTITTILAFLFIGERLTAKGWLGIFISCLGALCLVCKGSLQVLTELQFNRGDLIIVICEACWSAYVIMGWRIGSKVGVIALTAWSGLFGSLLCFIIGGLSGSLYANEVTSATWWSFAYMTLISGVFAFVGWNWAAAGVGASKAGAFVYIIPLSGAVFGVTMLGEGLSVGQLVGGALIVSGVVITVRAKVVIKAKAEAVGASSNLLEKFPELTKENTVKKQKVNG